MQIQKRMWVAFPERKWNRLSDGSWVSSEPSPNDESRRHLLQHVLLETNPTLRDALAKQLDIFVADRRLAA